MMRNDYYDVSEKVEIFSDECRRCRRFHSSAAFRTNIVKFVLDNHEADRTDWFCVNCAAGVSRSAAVCAAIMRILCNDDMPVFTNSHFCPNMTVYREVLNAWINRLSDENDMVSTEVWNAVNQDM